MHANIQLATAVVSGVVALLSILLSARANRSNTELQARLQGEIEQRRDEASKSARLEEVISRYRDPLLGSAFELQSRIYNFVRGGFAGYLDSVDPSEQSYAVSSTLFVVAQYLAWAEALRQGVQFLDLGDIERNRELAGHLEAIRGTLSSDTRFSGSFRILRVEQRAIGEIMLRSGTGEWSTEVPRQCIGYPLRAGELHERRQLRGVLLKS